MLNKILIWLLARSWARIGKTVEDRDLVYKALEKCYKNEVLKDTWPQFTDMLISYADDMKKEIIAARQWGAK